jgi:glycosyltransferase involved in cell wall biosynthesis
MRILLVSEDIPHATLGGLGKHVVTLGNRLIEAGHSVDLMGNSFHPYVHTPGDIAFKGRFLPGLDPTGANWKEDKVGFFIYWRHAYQARRFARAILAVAHDYDVIHYHGHQPIVANYIPQHVNFVQTRHDQGSDCLTYTRFRNGVVCRETDPRACAACATPRPNWLQRALSASSVRLWRGAVARAFRRHRVIFVSDFLRNNLARTLGPQPQAKSHVIHNFVDPRVLKAALVDNDPVSESPDIFIAARIDEAKGVGAFLSAIEGKLPAGRQIVVAGDGPQLASLSQRFAGKWIRFLGWAPYGKVVQLAARAKMVVVPSVCEESCGTTILEGLALGRPVLALRRGGTPELGMHERYPGQLELCDTFECMTKLLCAPEEPAPMLEFDADFRASVGRILPDILAVYCSNRVN